MSTPKQIKSAIKTVENLRKPKPSPIGEVLSESGYSESITKHPSTVTRSQGYQEALAPLLIKHNITVDRYLRNISEAMDATKVVTSHTEPDYEVPDHAIRLSAGKQAKELLPLNSGDNDKPMDNKELAQAMKDGMDEVELTHAVFRKGKVS